MQSPDRSISLPANDSIIQKRRSTHIAGLDLIRIGAALLVVFYHFAYWNWYECGCVDTKFPSLVPYSWWGWIGVQIFFVISGFVIALSAEGRTANGFLRSRVLRLAPGLWFFALLAFLVLLITRVEPLPAATLLLLKSLVLWPVGPWVDGVYWSLTIEVLFYSIVFLLLAAQRFDWLLPFAVVWLLVTTLFALVSVFDLIAPYSEPYAHIVHKVRDAYAARYMLLTSGPFFLVGLSIYFIERQGLTFARSLMFACSFIAAEISIYFLSLEMRPREFDVSVFVPGGVFLLGVLSVVGSVVASKAKTRNREREAYPVKLLGQASYPLYLVHFVTGRWMITLLLAAGFHPGLAAILAAVLCLAASLLFVYALEKKLRGWLAKRYDQLFSLVERLHLELARDAVKRF